MCFLFHTSFHSRPSRFSPIGIAFLLAGKIVGMADPEQAFLQLAWYMMTVLLGLAIHGFIILPLIYVIFARKNPFKHLFHMTQALLTALGTASRYDDGQVVTLG